MSEKYCNSCKWYDLQSSICYNRESDYYEQYTGNCCRHHKDIKQSHINWQREAQLQAAAAGELRILLAQRLEELRTQQTALRRHLALEDNDFDRVIVQWKIEQLQKHIEWLEEVLYGG